MFREVRHQDGRDDRAPYLALALLPLWAAVVIGFALLGRWADRGGRRR